MLESRSVKSLYSNGHICSSQGQSSHYTVKVTHVRVKVSQVFILKGKNTKFKVTQVILSDCVKENVNNSRIKVSKTIWGDCERALFAYHFNPFAFTNWMPALNTT